MTFGSPAVRAQVFEVIVRQAMAGAPWREICAGPMQVNNISPEEVEYEVDRRLNRGREALNVEQRQRLKEYVAGWEWLLAPKETPTRPQIDHLIAKLYSQLDLEPPRLIFCPSPPIMAFFTFCLDEENLSRQAYAAQRAEFASSISRSQNNSYENHLLSLLSDLPQDRTCGNNDWITQELQMRYMDMVQTLKSKMDSTLDNRISGYIKFGFKLSVDRFLVRASTVYSVASNAIPITTIRKISRSGGTAFNNIVPNAFGVWEVPDLLGIGFAREYLSETLNFEESVDELLRVWLELFAAAPWYSFYEDICFVGMNPTTVVYDEQFRLNNRSGPAIQFADGFQIFAVEGIAVPRKLIESPETISVQDIDVTDNIAVRRMLIDSYGAGRYLEHSRAEMIQEDEYGQLYRKELHNDEPIVMVRVKNSTPEADGTYKYYFLRVPPTMRTAKEAVAWTFDMNSREYEPEQET